VYVLEKNDKMLKKSIADQKISSIAAQLLKWADTGEALMFN
jgi:hypothetical protein